MLRKPLSGVVAIAIPIQRHHAVEMYGLIGHRLAMVREYAGIW